MVVFLQECTIQTCVECEYGFECVVVSGQSNSRPRNVIYFMKPMTKSFQTFFFKIYFCQVSPVYASCKLCKFIYLGEILVGARLRLAAWVVESVGRKTFHTFVFLKPFCELQFQMHSPWLGLIDYCSSSLSFYNIATLLTFSLFIKIVLSRTIFLIVNIGWFV